MDTSIVSVGGGGDAPRVADPRSDPDASVVREARFQALIRAWWLDERPGWTESDWWDVSMRDEVRGLLWLPAGPQLAQALADIGRLQRCLDAHANEVSGPTPTPGRSCVGGSRCRVRVGRLRGGAGGQLPCRGAGPAGQRPGAGGAGQRVAHLGGLDGQPDRWCP